MKPSNSVFTQTLMQWHYNQNTRTMPWKDEKDAYKIWLSEIILQQTRVEQGLPYYNAFIKKYPTIFHLAKAKEKDVFKLWEGLGYYNRCRNLLYTAKDLVAKYNGIMPDTYEGLLTLKGVGPYTAAAIASFAYNIPQAVVDGNVVRVLSRVFGMYQTIVNNEGKRIFNQKAQLLLDKKKPAEYNQAIMDFGATVCTPKLPNCNTCIFNTMCIAFNTESIQTLPVKKVKPTIKIRHFHYFIFIHQYKILLQQRKTNDIWKGLYEAFLMEKSSEKILPKEIEKVLHTSLKLPTPMVFSQTLSHQKIYGYFYTIPISDSSNTLLKKMKWVTISQVKKLAFPKLINLYLAAKGVI